MAAYCHLSKTIRLSSVAASLALAQPAALSQNEAIDGIAAVVNSSVITISQVRDLVGGRERSMREIFSGGELDGKVKEARKAALNDLIDRELILQEFKKLQKERGAAIPEYIIDDRMSAIIREEFGGDRAAFVRTLRAQGYSITQFKEIERDKIIVQAMRQQHVKDDFVISPTMIQRFYASNKGKFATPEQVRLRMIVLREDDSGADKEAMAKEIREKLASGADFARMAEMYSEDENTKDTGGDWGWIERDTLNKDLSDKAFALQAGQTSQVIKLGDSYYIINVEARKNAAVKPITEVREEIEKQLFQEERMKMQQRWLQSLREKAYIKIF